MDQLREALETAETPASAMVTRESFMVNGDAMVFCGPRCLEELSSFKVTVEK